MRAIYYFIGLIIIAACTNQVQTPNSLKKPPETDSPKIEFDTLIHDFGKVKAGEILVFSFAFINSGQLELIITKAEGDCGCINVKYPDKPVKPGETGMVEVQFNSAGMVGNQLKTIEIQSNCKEPKQLIIFAAVENDQLEFINRN